MTLMARTRKMKGLARLKKQIQKQIYLGELEDYEQKRRIYLVVERDEGNKYHLQTDCREVEYQGEHTLHLDLEGQYR